MLRNDMTKNRKTSSEQGFTFVELAVVLALIAVLTAMAAPGFGNLFVNNKLTEASNRFLSSITFARSEAVNRNDTVIMCHLNDLGTGCDNDARWEDGWVIWVDADNDSGFDVGEEIIMAQGLPAGYTLRAGNNQFTDRITFSPAGDATGSVGNNAEIFRVCDAQADITRARSIHLNGVGRAWVNRTAGAVACP